MTRTEYLSVFKGLTELMYTITDRKNSDYSGSVDALSNFHCIEKVRRRITAADGVFVRLSDKFMRIGNLMDNISGPKVVDESIDDTLIDMANYSLILLILLREARGEYGPKRIAPKFEDHNPAG